MKENIAMLVALTTAAGMAHAQSTVTLYGVADANVGSYKTNQISGTGATATIQSATLKKSDSGGLSGSRWGIRFTEDLGGGLSAIGNLESGLALDTGNVTQGGVFFGRRAIVGLSSTTFGTVTLGRNTTSYNDVAYDHVMMEASPFDPSTNNVSTSVATVITLSTLASKAALLSHNGSGAGAQQSWVGFNSRFDNSVKYATPNLSGFVASLTYGTGEDKTQTRPSRQSTSASVKYAKSSLVISAGYQSEGGAINQATGTKPALVNTVVGGSYNFGVAKLGVGFNRAQYKGAAAGGGDLDAQSEVNVSVAVPVGPWTFAAGYAQSKGDDLGKSAGFGVQAFYALSKRTLIYAGAVSTENYDKVANLAKIQAPLSTIERTSIAAVGMRHVF